MTTPSESRPIATQPSTPGDAGPAAPPNAAASRRAAEARFTIERLHAQGGLGQVSLAMDGQLKRPVALKEIRPDRRTDDARRRFVNEAEITGQLEHPGIVPIYALETDAAGEPYYAMRFIQGRPMSEAIRAFHQPSSLAGRASDGRLSVIPPSLARPANGFDSLAFRQMLQCFVSVCQTVGYAHSKAVIHRDLKPANVMLGDYGETLVVDWGLAKRVVSGQSSVFSGKAEEVVSRDAQSSERSADAALPDTRPAPSDATQPGQALGTPAYMAPEQARGEWDRVGPAADIFSLGATLYELLTNQRPMQGPDPFAVLENAAAGRFAAPRKIKPDVPRPLEAVCLKAMAFDPDKRYRTAKELAADVEHWLADEPVTAYAEPVLLRARRWMRRHRATATSGVSALVVAVVALAALAWQSERGRMALVKEQAATETQRQRAVVKEALAKTNLDRAMTAIDQMLVRVGDERLAHLPQFEEERRRILQDALALHHELLDQNPGDPQTRLAAGQTYIRLGQVHNLLEDWPAARQAYDLALTLLEPLAADHPENVDEQKALATALDKRAQTLWHDSKDAPALLVALAGFERARETWDHLHLAHPEDPDSLAQLAAVNYRTASLLSKTERRAEASPTFDRTMTLQKQLLAANATNLDYQFAFASVHFSAGAHYLTLGEMSKSAAAYAEGITLCEKLLADHPNHAKAQDELAYGHHNSGFIHHRQNQLDLAQRHYEQSLGYSERLIADHPGVARYRQHLPRTLFSLAGVYRQRHDSPEARQCQNGLAGLQARLIDGQPGTDEYQSNLAEAYNLLAIIQSGSDPAGALRTYDKSRTIRERLAADHPDRTEYQVSLAGTYVNVGNLSTRQDQLPRSLIWFARAVPLLDAVAATEPENRMARQFLVNAHFGRATVLSKLGRHRDAVKDWDQALASAEQRFQPWYKLQRAAAQVRAGEIAQAVAEANAVAAAAKANAGNLYDAACVYALASAAVKDDAKTPGADAIRLAEQHAARAVELLRQAIAKGYKDIEHLKKDDDLKALRERADYRKLVQDAEEKK